jgi:hypothetical protein
MNDQHATKKNPMLHTPTAYLPGIEDQFLRDEGKSLEAITACNITPNNMAPPMTLPYPKSV